MELVEEDDFPGAFEVGSGVGVGVGGIESGEEFGVAEEELTFSVIGFCGGLTGVGSSVEFEIQFSCPGEEIVGFFEGDFIEVLCFGFGFDHGESGGESGAVEAFDVPFGWTAASVAESEEVEGVIGASVVTVVFD